MSDVPQSDQLKLFVEAWSDAVRTIRVKGLTFSGAVIDLQVVTTADRASTTKTVTFPQDTMSIVALLTATGVKRGQCYASISVIEKGTGRADAIDLLAAGYIYDNRPLKWHWISGGVIEGPTDGQGFQRTITITDPPAIATADSGGQWNHTVPTGSIQKVRNLSATLTASATVGDRNIEIQVLDPSGNTHYVFGSPDQTANQARDFHMGPYGFYQTAYDDLGKIRLGGPLDLVLAAGWQLQSAINGGKMADDWSLIFLNVEEMIET